MTRMDRILILGVLLIALMTLFLVKGFHSQGQSVVAIIQVEGDIVETIDLSKVEKVKNLQIQGAQGLSTIEVENSRIRMVESPCPDQVCVNRGWIERAGEAIVCVPNEIVIKIKGNDESVDDITQ